MRRNYNTPARRWKRGLERYRKSHRFTGRRTQYSNLYLNGKLVGAVQSMKWTLDTFSPIKADVDLDNGRSVEVLPREYHATVKNLRIRGDIVADTMRRAKLLMIDDPGWEAA